MAKVKKDIYPNRAMSSVTQTAANTITFEQINFGVGIFQGVALVLHRVEYMPDGAALNELAAFGDTWDMGLTTSNLLADLQAFDPAVISMKRMLAIGAAVEPFELPLITDFTTMPGGGLILPPNPLFMCVDSLGNAAAHGTIFQLYFTFVELADKDYIELIQSQLPANIA